MEFASNPHQYSSSEHGANIYLNGVPCSSGYFDATSLTQKLDSVKRTDYQVYQPRGRTSGTSSMRQSFLGTPNFVNLNQTDGMWLLEPRKFDNHSRPKIHFEISAMLKDRINDNMVELGRLDTLDEGKFTFSDNTTVLNNADFLLTIKTATDSLPNTFPPTVIGIRNDDPNLAEIMPSSTNNLENGNLESIFKNALYVYLPEVFLDRNEVIYLYVSADGSTYFANTSLSKKGEPDLDRPL